MVMRLAIYQPVVPNYRILFFNYLARRSDVHLYIAASQSFPGSPPTVYSAYEFEFSEHPVKSFFKNRVFWQGGLQVPSYFEPGDAIVISGNLRMLSNLPLIISARNRGIGVIWWTHMRSSGTTWWSFLIRRWVMQIADAVLLYTDKEVAAFRKFWRNPCLFGLNNTLDISVIDEEKARWSDEQLNKFRLNMGLSDQKVLLFCSRLTKEKRVDLLLQALLEVTRVDDTYLLLIIGDGPDRCRLEALAMQLGINKKIRWIGGIYDERSLAPRFLSSLAFVYPGPIGLSIIHAFAYELPVVIGDNWRKHGPEYAAFQQGTNGVAFTWGSATSLASAIRDVTTSEQHRTQMALAAYRTVRGEFSMDNMVNRFVAAARCGAERAKSRFWNGSSG